MACIVQGAAAVPQRSRTTADKNELNGTWWEGKYDRDITSEEALPMIEVSRKRRSKDFIGVYGTIKDTKNINYFQSRQILLVA